MKAFIFDLDGTLIDSLEDLADAVNLMLAQHGFPGRPLDLFPKLIGEGVHSLVERAIPDEVRATADIPALVTDYQAHYQNTWRSKTRPYAGIGGVLDRLRAGGVRTAVLSNKPDRFTRLCCEHFFPPGTFDIVLGARDNVPRKPHPQAALEVSRGLGVALDECVYAGDSGLDMQFAVNAGMYPAGVLWGFRGRDELVECGARFLAEKPSDLLKLLA
jgi:phosphoglycolate phosphatase